LIFQRIDAVCSGRVVGDIISDATTSDPTLLRHALLRRAARQRHHDFETCRW
jgi:hypothetical protein